MIARRSAGTAGAPTGPRNPGAARRVLPRRGAWLSAVAVLPSLTLGLVLCGGSAAATDTLSARSDTPRAFGYTVGDVVSRRITLQVPAGLKLDEDSLPRAGARGRALELQRVVLRRSLTGVPEELQLDYQVFLAPRELRVLEMPPIELRFDGSPRPQSVRIDAWPVTVAPLTPADPSPREGLGEMRPDWEPPRLDTAAVRLRLALEGGVVLLLLGYLAQVYLVLPWSARRRRPFGRAWAALRALPAEADAAERRAAFERLHAALNETAGEVLFEPGLDNFIAARPRFAPLRDELGRFFAASRAEFFAAGRAAGDARWLVDLCRRCRDLERGAA
jgi:mxaA protein